MSYGEIGNTSIAELRGNFSVFLCSSDPSTFRTFLCGFDRCAFQKRKKRILNRKTKSTVKINLENHIYEGRLNSWTYRPQQKREAVGK